MKKKLYNTGTLFAHIINLMNEEKTLPENMLDYYLPTRTIIPIKYYGFDIVGDLKFGGSEGIYLTMFLEGYITKDREHKKVHLGTFKTLREDRDSFKQMAILMADFIYIGRKFINDNIDDFDHPIEE